MLERLRQHARGGELQAPQRHDVPEPVLHVRPRRPLGQGVSAAVLPLRQEASGPGLFLEPRLSRARLQSLSVRRALPRLRDCREAVCALSMPEVSRVAVSWHVPLCLFSTSWGCLSNCIRVGKGGCIRETSIWYRAWLVLCSQILARRDSSLGHQRVCGRKSSIKLIPEPMVYRPDLLRPTRQSAR